MSTANTFEREMLTLINQERTSRGLNSVQLEAQLNDSSEDHSTWMLNTDTFSHSGLGGSNATDRMETAGFDLSGSWRTGENIAWQSERGAPGISDDVTQLHQDLMNSPGHRANILNPDFKYVGIGIETGEMQGFDAVMVTQNFAATDAEVMLDNGITPPQPEPATPVNEIAEPDEAATEIPGNDVTETEVPEINSPNTEVTEAEVPEGEAPGTGVTEPEDPVKEVPDSDVVDTGDPAGCFTVATSLAEITMFLEALQSQLDQFSWNSTEITPSESALDDTDMLAEVENDLVDEAPVADLVNNGACDLFVFNYFDMNCMLEAA